MFPTATVSGFFPPPFIPSAPFRNTFGLGAGAVKGLKSNFNTKGISLYQELLHHGVLIQILAFWLFDSLEKNTC